MRIIRLGQCCVIELIIDSHLINNYIGGLAWRLSIDLWLEYYVYAVFIQVLSHYLTIAMFIYIKFQELKIEYISFCIIFAFIFNL